MVQKPSLTKDSDENISWKDLQGLTWILSEESSFESAKNPPTYACA